MSPVVGSGSDTSAPCARLHAANLTSCSSSCGLGVQTEDEGGGSSDLQASSAALNCGLFGSRSLPGSNWIAPPPRLGIWEVRDAMIAHTLGVRGVTRIARGRGAGGARGSLAGDAGTVRATQARGGQQNDAAQIGRDA